MTKRPLKLLPVWLAVSAVIIIAGIILAALLGFNNAPDRKKSVTFEVRYDVSVDIDPERAAALGELCDKALEKYTVSRREGDDISYDMTVITYTLSENVTETQLGDVKKAITDGIAEKGDMFADSDISMDYHILEGIPVISHKTVWRGAVALTVAAVVGLIYVCIRFGIAQGLTGLVLAAHDAVFTVAFIAAARIPVYAFSPILFASVAAIFSIALWLVHCMKLRDVKKDAALRNLQSAEAVEYAWENSWLKIVIVASVALVLFAVAGGVAAAGVRYLLLPAMISVGAAAYSSLLLGPALHVHVKGAFDKLLAKHKPRYAGKKKAEKSAESEASAN